MVTVAVSHYRHCYWHWHRHRHRHCYCYCLCHRHYRHLLPLSPSPSLSLSPPPSPLTDCAVRNNRQTPAEPWSLRTAADPCKWTTPRSGETTSDTCGCAQLPHEWANTVLVTRRVTPGLGSGRETEHAGRLAGPLTSFMSAVMLESRCVVGTGVAAALVTLPSASGVI